MNLGLQYVSRATLRNLSPSRHLFTCHATHYIAQEWTVRTEALQSTFHVSVCIHTNTEICNSTPTHAHREAGQCVSVWPASDNMSCEKRAIHKVARADNVVKTLKAMKPGHQYYPQCTISCGLESTQKAICNPPSHKYTHTNRDTHKPLHPLP